MFQEEKKYEEREDDRKEKEKEKYIIVKYVEKNQPISKDTKVND